MLSITSFTNACLFSLLLPFRVDEEEHNDWIPDKIIKEIKRSKFMIADLTGNRSGVYYEAGFAEGLGLQVIYTCNQDWFNEKIA